jgi:hypothetical protein
MNPVRQKLADHVGAAYAKSMKFTSGSKGVKRFPDAKLGQLLAVLNDPGPLPKWVGTDIVLFINSLDRN